LPLFAKTQLGGQIGTLAGMEASVGIGTVAGGLALSVVRLEARTWTRVTIGLAITSLMYLLFSVNRSASAADVFLLVLGLALSLVNISLLTFFQTRPRASDVPVVMGLVNLISVGALPFSMLMLGGALSRVELHPLAVSLALVLGLVTAVTASHREFRNV
jgi:hypothetical protein